ncbi:ABC transporter ATP-binding protein/permease [Gracilibacillus caseinilyticus]|uniref:ABC transporter ATP-binding protein/permease n=1 Tax=Gracilibacillus caseinilyticus TaxID=2932256 RepID=A0ABY4F1M7_9BACI|nr:ABC transporter ATP-binding protein [Gracilibacillus caseinilyticus]UOQ50067.1 ABC transporter ATP-binding protein/permease [Gracilibacillus caseinilyticus]
MTNKNQPIQPPSRHHPPIGKKPKVKNLRVTLMRIWSYMETDKAMFWLVLAMIVASAVLSLLGPYFIGIAVDVMTGATSMFSFQTILIILVVVFILHSLTLALQNYWMIDISQNTVYSMRQELFGHVLRLPLISFQKTQSGDLMSRLTNDIENVSRTLNTAVIQVTTSVLTLVGTLVVMVLLSPLLTLMTITIVPLMYAGMKWITNRTGYYFKEQQRELGEMTGFLEETLSGHSMVKLFHQEQRVIEQYRKQNKKLREVGYWAQVYSGFIPKLMNGLNNFGFAIIVGVGGWIVLYTDAEAITIGIIVTFTTYARQFTRPLNDLANQFNTILSAVAGAERAFEVMDQDEEELYQGKRELEQVKGEVIFDHVSFSYNEEEQVLRNVSFHAEAGQTVALVGPTGAGKTTIISLLARFFMEREGEILLDGVPLSELSNRSIRKHLGMVLQDSYLFDTTIRENIRYGKLDATDQEVLEAARLANADAFIQQLPEQYDTVLEGNGRGISQGQRQLIAIARAMLADPAILILDEATSSIDTITELRITDALQTLMKGKTSFIIAHRLNTIEKADMILVLKDGAIIEKGDHSSLMKQKGFYANLVTTQTTYD